MLRRVVGALFGTVLLFLALGFLANTEQPAPVGPVYIGALAGIAFVWWHRGRAGGRPTWKHMLLYGLLGGWLAVMPRILTGDGDGMVIGQSIGGAVVPSLLLSGGIALMVFAVKGPVRAAIIVDAGKGNAASGG